MLPAIRVNAVATALHGRSSAGDRASWVANHRSFFELRFDVLWETELMKHLHLLAAAAAGALAVGAPASAANLLINGDFEGSTSQTTTPPASARRGCQAGFEE